MLGRPALQLERYFFPVVNVEADPDFDPSQKPELGLTAVIHKDKVKGELRRWVVQLDVTVAPKEKGPFTYKAFLKVIGFFNVSAEMREEEIPSFVEVNGGSILFSAAREYLLILTSRGPWPPLALPTVRIVPDELKAPEMPVVKDIKPKKLKGKKTKK